MQEKRNLLTVGLLLGLPVGENVGLAEFVGDPDS